MNPFQWVLSVLLANIMISATSPVRFVSEKDIPAYEAYNRGVALNSLDIHRAIAEYERAIDIKDDLTEAHQNLGLLYERRGDMRMARDTHLRAIQSAGNDAEASFRAALLSNLGDITVKIGLADGYDIETIDEGIKILQQAVLVDEFSEQALQNLGQSYFRVGQYKSANQIFIKLVKLNPENGMANLNIGNGFFMQKKFRFVSMTDYQCSLCNYVLPQ